MKNKKYYISIFFSIAYVMTTLLLQQHRDSAFLTDTEQYITEMIKAFSASGFIASFYFEKQRNIIILLLATIPLISFFLVK